MGEGWKILDMIEDLGTPLRLCFCLTFCVCVLYVHTSLSVRSVCIISSSMFKSISRTRLVHKSLRFDCFHCFSHSFYTSFFPVCFHFSIWLILKTERDSAVWMALIVTACLIDQVLTWKLWSDVSLSPLSGWWPTLANTDMGFCSKSHLTAWVFAAGVTDLGDKSEWGMNIFKNSSNTTSAGLFGWHSQVPLRGGEESRGSRSGSENICRNVQCSPGSYFWLELFMDCNKWVIWLGAVLWAHKHTYQTHTHTKVTNTAKMQRVNPFVTSTNRTFRCDAHCICMRQSAAVGEGGLRSVQFLCWSRRHWGNQVRWVMSSSFLAVSP